MGVGRMCSGDGEQLHQSGVNCYRVGRVGGVGGAFRMGWRGGIKGLECGGVRSGGFETTQGGREVM